MEKGGINLYYWPIRGLNRSIVNLLEFCGLNYTLHKISSREEWFKLKEELFVKGLDFPNLPFIEHNGKYHSESFALLTYVATASGNHDLLPQPESLVRFIELFGVLGDLDSCFTGPAYRCKSNEELSEVITNGVKQHGHKISSINKILSKSKWLQGENLSVLDFKLAETLERMKIMGQELNLEGYGLDWTHLDRYLKDFSSLPQIENYRKSDRYFERPFNNSMAHWK